MEHTDMQSLGTPIAIVIAGALVALSIYFSGFSPSPRPAGTPEPAAAQVAPVTPDDHIFGNPSAAVTIIEYSDLECPFCKQFHTTVERIVAESNGTVRWVYRNFPLTELHPNALRLAEAAECVADIGGNDAYWKFLSELFRRAPINTPFPMEQLGTASGAVGVDAGALTACLNEGRFSQKVAASVQEAIAAGGQGTPHNVVIGPKGERQLPGAQPYESVKAAIEAVR